MRTLGALGLVALLATTVNGLAIREPDSKDWYQHATFYQIYPRSFLDSNGDGIGDLAGITSKMKYLADIGIDATWLSPPFKSPLKDFGYDVSDFYDIQPEYGNLTDFDKLVEESHKNGIKLMLDFIPNHSSDQHEWFVKSVLRDPEYSDFYVWRPPATGGGPPNNWISVFGGSAWTYNQARGEYYLHQFTPQQPDLNYRNPKVLAEMTKMLFFWLDRGVDGFRLDAINHMFEDEQFRDEPLSGWGQPGEYDSLDHIYTKDIPDVYDVVYNWRDQMDKYSAEKGRTIILMTEAYSSIEGTMLYYESADRKRQGAHMPFNFQLIYDFKKEQNAVGLKNSIDWWMNNMPARHTPSWVAGSHDHSRVASRVGLDRVDQVMTLLHTLPGTSITYYGEEVAMQDFKEAQQFDNRDPNRTPMQWDSSTSAGFSTNTNTWLRVHPDYARYNVDVMQKNPQSTFHHFQHLTKLRRHRTMQSGEYVHKTVGTKVYALLRELRGEDSFLTVLNMAGAEDTVDLGDFVNLPQKMRVEVAQPNSKSKAGNEVDIGKLTLGPYDSVVLRATVSSAAAINLSIGLLLAIMARYIFV
ncbi:neutral and basic amino acid transport protein rBAT [Culex quinquefasciatus]|uniref:alpha-glucosidase n=1 Tax=Culex quinquefasciatus TaxID=7176 RepID=B0X223_CULQU|nr:neutral and basic amino acid transport protein rBAT [Culex quinquefasciatus]|eukprot:XP_001863695.1 neutral and basic amino acid transport protein rBAT [Culex quinquefasciatus]